MSLTRSPLAPDGLTDLPQVTGFNLGTAAVGGYYGGRDNLLVIEAAAGSQVAGVFTQNAVCGAPVTWTKAVTKTGNFRGLIVNAGNANVATGPSGLAAAQACAAALASRFETKTEHIAIASTGVIGQLLDPKPYAQTANDVPLDNTWAQAATAIMTTDTFQKGAAASCIIDGQPVQITAIAKGSGMIEPNMATMLAFVATDANLPADVLDPLLREAVGVSLNAVTVDGDTSTSDMCLLMASCQASHPRISDPEDERLDDFLAALNSVLRDLAILIARDGEGASKLITIDVKGAVSDAEAMICAKAIANSSLVKTAIAGQDANWGRIAMAAGKSGARLNANRLSIGMGEKPILVGGTLPNDYNETPVAQHLEGQEITVQVDLAIGHGKARAWTCDLTHGYIEINADYRS